MDLGSLALALTDDGVPHYRRLYQALRRAIVSGRIAPGQRLPASRTLAEQLSLARGTVLQAYEQLSIEGYITTRRGAGTFVATVLPEQLDPASSHPHPLQLDTKPRPVSQRMQQHIRHHTKVLIQSSTVRPFQSGLAPLDAFPRTTLARLANATIRSLPMDTLGYNVGAGYQPLREALAAYLRTTRGLQCTAHQIIVTTGSQQGLHLAAEVLCDSGDQVWVEDPCYGGARAAFVAKELTLAPVPVDEQGLNVEAGRAQAPHAQMAYVTPAHQFPLGPTLSLERRIALLQWAEANEAWILEDDYDGEFRYAGQPLATLQSLDRHQRVIYVGSFSKVLAPALRLGYLVVPEDLVETFILAKTASDRHTPLLMQAVLAAFIHEGHFGRHLRRMRKLCHERQQALLDALEKHLRPWLTFGPDPAGLHLTTFLRHHADDQAVAEQAAQIGIRLSPLSRYRIQAPIPPGIVLGYASFTASEMQEAARRLARVLA